MKELIKKIIKEALGVPDNIVNVANQIFDDIINSVKDKTTVEKLDGKTFIFKGDYRIADLKLKKVEFVFDFFTDYENNKIDVMGMATSGQFKITKKFKIKSLLDKNTFTLKISIATPGNPTGKEIKDYMIQEKSEFISSISHELKHRYDDFKKPKTSLTQRAEYRTYTGNRFRDIKPINEFLHNLYFIHSIENLVRPSELAGAIKAGDITKKGFYEFLTNNRVYKKLKEIQGFTYEGFRNSLKEYIPQIKELFDDNDVNYYDDSTDDEIIDKMLEIILINITHWKAQSAHSLLASSPIEMLMGFSGDKDKFFRQYIQKLSKYDNGNFIKYFEYEEKMFRFVATNMIKKISKLYDMTKDETNESIINWELWHKLKGTDSNIVTENKSWADKNYLLPKKHPMVQAIIKAIGDAGVFNDSYSLPYDENDGMVDYQIDYHIDKVSLWADEDGEYNGTVYLMLDRITLGDSEGDDWERVYGRDDLPSWSWDRLEEDVIGRVEKWIPNVGVDIELIFPGYKG